MGVVPQSAMDDPSVVANALCAIREDGTKFRGSCYKICSSPKENEKKFAESAQVTIEKVVVFAEGEYGFILVNYGGHNDVRAKPSCRAAFEKYGTRLSLLNSSLFWLNLDGNQYLGAK